MACLNRDQVEETLRLSEDFSEEEITKVLDTLFPELASTNSDTGGGDGEDGSGTTPTGGGGHG